jgi:cyclic dehypoxanthinyl futalosine synthase
MENAKKGRVKREEALDLFQDDIYTLGKRADMVKKEVLGTRADYACFIIDRNINTTNICSAKCNFCAFYREKNDADSFILTVDEILEKAGELQAIGGTQVMIQGGLNEKCDLKFYTQLFSAIKKRYPAIYIHSLTPTEINYLAKIEKRSVYEIILELKEAGLQSLPGAAEILVDEHRKMVSPHKLKTSEWVEVMENIHKAGMRATATMTFGMGESFADRIEHLFVIRDLQDRTGVFRAFIPWTFSKPHTRLNVEETTGEDYIKTVAISRIVLDNITHIHAGWVTEGFELSEMALRMGASDMGGILMEELVVKATGTTYTSSKETMIEVIKNAGLKPAIRDTEYNIIKKCA